MRSFRFVARRFNCYCHPEERSDEGSRPPGSDLGERDPSLSLRTTALYGSFGFGQRKPIESRSGRASCGGWGGNSGLELDTEITAIRAHRLARGGRAPGVVQNRRSVLVRSSQL